MDPYVMLMLARQRQHELRKAAEQYHPLVPRRRCRSVRHWAGWAFVEFGLMLVDGSGNA